MPFPTLSATGSIPVHSLDKLERVLDHVAQEVARGARPEHLDRAYLQELLPKSYDAYGVLSTLRRFGALNPNRNTRNDTLWRVADPRQRKATFADILRREYAPVLAVAEKPNATRQQIEEEITRQFNLHGSTRAKAAGFFIAACKYTGIPVAPEIARNAELGRLRRAGAPFSEQVIPEDEPRAGSTHSTSAVTHQEETDMQLARAPSL